MSDKPKYDPNIHHRRSIRLKGYDYSQAGAYYITICCQDRACLFGKIEHGEMILNDYGTITYNEWLNTPNIRKNVELDVFVIMPNHMHGIVILTRRGELHSPCNELPNNLVWGECNSPLRGTSNTIGAIVRGYKSSVTKQLNLLNIGCVVWQRNYYEHIIRNEQQYQRISDYIIDNPAKWKDDKFYL